MPSDEVKFSQSDKCCSTLFSVVNFELRRNYEVTYVLCSTFCVHVFLFADFRSVFKTL